jgi:low temperature requirement protein LtrA
VAAALQIGHIVQYNISFEALFRAGLLFAVMRGTWDQLMFYQNRFDTKDLLHYLFYLVQAMCVFVMANHLTINEKHHHWDLDRNMKPFAIAAAIARITHVGMYYQVINITSKYRHHMMALSMSERISALLFLLSAVIPGQEKQYYIYWVVALVCERTLVQTYIALFINDADSNGPFSLPWHTGHIYHREVTHPASPLYARTLSVTCVCC